MISRHYKFEVLVFLEQPVGLKVKRRTLKYGGIVFNKSLLPNPGAAYVKAMQHAMEEAKKAGVEVHPEQLEMAVFERIK